MLASRSFSEDDPCVEGMREGLLLLNPRPLPLLLALLLLDGRSFALLVEVAPAGAVELGGNTRFAVATTTSGPSPPPPAAAEILDAATAAGTMGAGGL